MARTPDDVTFSINVPDYLVRTMHFATRHHGMLLLLTMWALKNGGWLPAYEKGLAKLAKCSRAQWKKDRPYMVPFFEVTADRWTHKHLSIGRVRELYLTDGRLPAARWQVVRARIFERDNHTCTYCGATEAALECDHVVPVSRGGTNDDSNLTTACRPCNLSKRAKTPDEWRASLG